MFRTRTSLVDGKTLDHTHNDNITLSRRQSRFPGIWVCADKGLYLCTTRMVMKPMDKVNAALLPLVNGLELHGSEDQAITRETHISIKIHIHTRSLPNAYRHGIRICSTIKIFTPLC